MNKNYKYTVVFNQQDDISELMGDNSHTYIIRELTNVLEILPSREFSYNNTTTLHCEDVTILATPDNREYRIGSRPYIGADYNIVVDEVVLQTNYTIGELNLPSPSHVRYTWSPQEDIHLVLLHHYTTKTNTLQLYGYGTYEILDIVEVINNLHYVMELIYPTV